MTSHNCTRDFMCNLIGVSNREWLYLPGASSIEVRFPLPRSRGLDELKSSAPHTRKPNPSWGCNGPNYERCFEAYLIKGTGPFLRPNSFHIAKPGRLRINVDKIFHKVLPCVARHTVWWDTTSSGSSASHYSNNLALNLIYCKSAPIFLYLYNTPKIQRVVF